MVGDFIFCRFGLFLSLQNQRKTVLMIESLPYRKVVTIRREITTTGHSPLEVLADDYNIYFIKSAQDQKPSYRLISEFLCHYFLKCWHIPTPAIAEVTLDSKLITDGFSDKHKKHFYNRSCFGSQSIKDSIDLNEFFNPRSKPDFKKFYNPEILFKIALFDIWVENDDRKPTNNNILLQPVNGRFNIIAIDHAYTFNTMNYDDLNPIFVSLSFNDTILLSPLGQSVKKRLKKDAQWLADVKENFYLCVKLCEQNFIDISASVPQHLGFDLRLQTKLHSFLFNEKRNSKVFTEFTSRLI